jgi:hypothetical protein
MDFYESRGDEIVDRTTLARRLFLSPNRVSELVRDGVLQIATRMPLRFSVQHNQDIYANYRAGVVRRVDEHYCEVE